MALAHRDQTGQGQLVDVSVNAACNVSSEQTTYHWLVNNETCVRQTGRHAYFTRSQPTQVRCARATSAPIAQYRPAMLADCSPAPRTGGREWSS
ncbi:CoA transferase [Mycobacterium malmoense]|uniref:CoA transferase n=1 Tax=Mycobacterium malmoense TaxID=1780 RepID=UPI0021004D37|nr:CoA transferase [Mycobacterium malmoense]